MDSKREQVRDLLNRVYQAHEIYAKQKDNNSRIIVEERCKLLFDKLENLGVSRAFSEAFLVYGNEFMKQELGVEWEIKS